MRLSPRSIYALARLITVNEKDLAQFFYRHGYSLQFQGVAALYGSDALSLLKDLDTGVFVHKPLPPLEAARRAHQAGAAGASEEQGAILAICQDALADFPESELTASLQRSLELDGLRYSEGRLAILDKAAQDLTQDQDELEQLVDRSRLPKAQDILHHLSLAEKHYLAGRWDDCNSQSRKFLELLIAGIAKAVAVARSKVIPTRQVSPQSHEYLDFLKNEGLLDAYEEKLISAAYAYIGNRGAHPGRSSQSEAAKKRLMATMLARLVGDVFLDLEKPDPPKHST